MTYRINEFKPIMKTLLSIGILFFIAPGLCLAQQRTDDHSAIIVNVTNVNAGLLSSVMEGISKAFDPHEVNTNWPLYAYDVRLLGFDFCEEHGRAFTHRGVAFVGRVSGDLIGKSPRHLGIKTTDISRTLDTCKTLMEPQNSFDFMRRLDNHIGNIEDSHEYLHSGRLEKIHLSAKLQDVAGTGNSPCIKHLKSGILTQGQKLTEDPSGGTSVGKNRFNTNTRHLPGGLQWTGRIGNAEHSSVKLIWSEGSHSVRSINDMIDSLSRDMEEMWQFTPNDPGQIGGHFLITYNKSQRHQDGNRSVTSLWNNNDIEWEEMSGDANDYGTGSFDMWYLPPFCGKSGEDPWYLVSRYRLGFDRELGFRGWIDSLKAKQISTSQ